MDVSLRAVWERPCVKREFSASMSGSQDVAFIKSGRIGIWIQVFGA